MPAIESQVMPGYLQFWNGHFPGQIPEQPVRPRRTTARLSTWEELVEKMPAMHSDHGDVFSRWSSAG